MPGWRAWVAPGILFLGRAADLGSTWLVAGGALRGEQNPIHLAFGWGWWGLVGTSVLYLAILVPAYLWAHRAGPSLYPSGAPLGFSAFWVAMLYGRPVPAWHLLWRMPPWRRMTWVVAKFFTWALALFGFLAAAGNLAGASGPAGARFWGALIGSWQVASTVILALTMVTFAFWALAEHSHYLHVRLAEAGRRPKPIAQKRTRRRADAPDS